MSIEIKPNTDLGKWMIAVTQEVAAISPHAFKDVDLLRAINEAEAIRPRSVSIGECSDGQTEAPQSNTEGEG